MCGLAGFFNPGGVHADTARTTAAAMAGEICHRGPDDEGVWIDETAGIALSHRRLSIVDLSPLGHQPMTSKTGRYVLAFNGEIYNYVGLAAELKDRDHAFRGHSDTEVLLAAVEEWGLTGAIRRANGMFAIALWDRQERALHLCRDRAGEKPLYYGWSGKTFLFGSELKALRRHPDFSASIDRDALTLYLRYNCIPGPYSIYQGIRKLPPATILTVTAADRTSEPVEYWSMRDTAEAGLRNPLAAEENQLVDMLDELLRDAVRLRMQADVPLGAFLSGGIDSSAIVALMQAQSASPVRTFTIGFDDPRYDEAVRARAVASHLRTEHTELYVTPREVMAVIPRLPRLYDEPFADSSQIPTFLVAEMTRRHVTVSLSGDGGDELFGGYNRHVWGRTLRRRVDWLPQPLRTVAASALQAPPPAFWDRLSRLTRGIVPAQIGDKDLAGRVVQFAGLLSANHPEEVYRSFVSHWSDPASVVLGGREPPVPLDAAGGWASGARLTEQMMLLDATSYLPDDILVKVDRASMGVGLEARVPLLDHRVIEFAWRVPLSMKIRDGKGKWLLRQVLDRYVPRELTERPKRGFAIPLGAWLRGPLRSWAESLLDERRLRDEGFIDVRRVREIWSEHVSGRRNRETQLWEILMFQAWLEAQPAADLLAGPGTTGSVYLEAGSG